MDAGMALAAPNMRPASLVEGKRPETSGGGSSPFAALIMYTGTTEDILNFGKDHVAGDFLHGLTGEVIGKMGRMDAQGRNVAEGGVVEIAPIAAFATYSKWEKDQREPTYSYPSWDKVPPQHQPDFEWRDGPEGRLPPAGTETIHAIVIVKGRERPFLIRFKRTGMDAWQGKRGIVKYMEEFGVCWFELSSTGEKNPAGQPYRKMHARFLRKLVPETDAAELAFVDKVQAAWKEWRAKAEAIEETETAGEAKPYVEEGAPF